MLAPGMRGPAPAKSWELAAGLAVGLIAVGLVACAAPPPAPQPPSRPLRLAIHSEPLSLDPHFHNEALTFSVLRNVYEALTTFGPSMNVLPALAERWENPDDVTWRFVLRDGVRFHDGRPLTATDVVASLERARRHPRTGFSSYLVAVREIRAVDPRTVELVTVRPYPILLNKLAFVMVVPADAPGDEEIREPIGTGAYRLVSSRPGAGVELERFAGYWRELPAEPRVELLPIPDPEERVRRLLAGEVDLIEDLPASSAPRLQAAPCCRVASLDSLLVEYLVTRPDRPPFDDPRVRRAVDLALDRRRLVDQVLGGFGAPLGQIVGRNVFGHDPEMLPTERDLDAARTLLVEAGYPDGLDVELELRAGRAHETLVAQLAEAGIRVTVRARPWAEVYARLEAGEVGFYLGGVIAVSADASDIFDSMVHTRDPEHGYGQNNFFGYANPELDALVQSSGVALDMLERRAELRRGLRLLAADRVYLPLYTAHEIYGVRRDLEWEPRGDGFLGVSEMRRSPIPP